MLARVAKRNPQRLQARFVNSNVARPTADDDSVAQLLGPDASADEIETANVKIANLEFDPEKFTVQPQFEIDAGPRVLVRTEGAKLSKSSTRALVPVYQERTVDRVRLQA